MCQILKAEWRSGRDTVGIVLAEGGDGKLRAYIGVAHGDNEDFDANYIALYGARLSLDEARGFFPDLKEEEYGSNSI